MRFIDNVSAFTKGVGQKAKGNYVIAAMNSKISSLIKEIRSLYTQIGETYYGIHKEDAEEPLCGMVENIKSLETQIADVKQQIETTREAMATVSLSAVSATEVPTGDGSYGFCESCGATLLKDSLFCVKCGAKVISKEVAPEQEMPSIQ